VCLGNIAVALLGFVFWLRSISAKNMPMGKMAILDENRLVRERCFGPSADRSLINR
jgi:hypothetical protein